MSFPPQKFGRYYVYDKLAVGGMAEIYKARLCGSMDFQKKLVIKKLNVGKKDRAYVTKLFIDEAHLCATLNHPNIVQTYDFSCLDGNYFIAMEYVEGQDLKQLLIRTAQNRKQLSIDCALFVVHELSTALSYLHTKKTTHGKAMGLIHRDISPANILISYKGEVKLADFGIAKNQYRLYESDQGVRKGKHEYMSPEQASCSALDHRSDIFSTGIILYELLTGRRLFKGSSDTDALMQVQNCVIPPASSINPRIPPRLNQIIHTALQKNPALRYQNAEQFRKAVLEALHPKKILGARKDLLQLMNRSFSKEREEENHEENKVRSQLIMLEKTKDTPKKQMQRKQSLPIKKEEPQDLSNKTEQALNNPSNQCEKVLKWNSNSMIPWMLCACFFLLWIISVL